MRWRVELLLLAALTVAGLEEDFEDDVIDRFVVTVGDDKCDKNEVAEEYQYFISGDELVLIDGSEAERLAREAAEQINNRDPKLLAWVKNAVMLNNGIPVMMLVLKWVAATISALFDKTVSDRLSKLRVLWMFLYSVAFGVAGNPDNLNFNHMVPRLDSTERKAYNLMIYSFTTVGLLFGYGEALLLCAVLAGGFRNTWQTRGPWQYHYVSALPVLAGLFLTVAPWTFHIYVGQIDATWATTGSFRSYGMAWTMAVLHAIIGLATSVTAFRASRRYDRDASAQADIAAFLSNADDEEREPVIEMIRYRHLFPVCSFLQALNVIVAHVAMDILTFPTALLAVACSAVGFVANVAQTIYTCNLLVKYGPACVLKLFNLH